MKTLLMLLILVACSKQPGILQVAKSVTYLHHYYNEQKSYLKTDTAIHWCKVTGEELKRFEDIKLKKEPYCDNNDTLELRISKACPSLDQVSQAVTPGCISILPGSLKKVL